jgi:alpha-galactosidase
VQFHATVVHATGGMLLSGDDLPRLGPDGVAMLKKLIPPTGRAASFEDETLSVGRARTRGGEFIYLFNWGDEPAHRAVTFQRRVALTDYWTGESLGEQEGEFRVAALPPRSAKMLLARQGR